MSKNSKTNYASLLNKKKLFPNRQTVSPVFLKSTKGTQILKKIGNSSEEIYTFLTSTTSKFQPKYLPPFVDCNIEYLNNLILGVQECYSANEAGKVNLETIDELAVKRAKPWLEERPEMLKMLPPRYEKNKDGLKVLRMPHREFVFTIWKLKDPDGFYQFVDEGRTTNKTRIKHREATEIQILNEFYLKAQDYDQTNYDKGTMPASIFNKYNKMETKRKRDEELGRNGSDDSSEDDEVYQPDEEEDEDEQAKEQFAEVLKTKLVEVETQLDSKSKMIKHLEVTMMASVFERVKDIEDPEQRRQAYDERAAQMEEDFEKFNLKIPPYEDVFDE